MTLRLLIGGTADGQYQNVNDRYDIHLVPSPDDFTVGERPSMLQKYKRTKAAISVAPEGAVILVAYVNEDLNLTDFQLLTRLFRDDVVVER